MTLTTGRTGSAAPQSVPADEIIFACRQPGAGSHWYENFGYYAHEPSEKLYGSQGRLCRLRLSDCRLAVLLDDPAGAIRDPQVHYDGKRILFSYRPGGSDYFHLYEIDADGRDLRQLTQGAFDDIEPTYLPSGQIMFCSSRGNRWVPCWYSQVATLHVCDGNGGNIRPISANIEHDNTPWPLPDGRVIYERWEYVDRSRVGFHHLWTANPDGTSQMIYYGNLHPGTLMIDAKPIPGRPGEVVAVFSPKHGRREHEGVITILTPNAGPDVLVSARQVSLGDDFRDPYPLAADCFLVARGASLLVMNGQGETRELFRLSSEQIAAKVECHEPRPLAARPREPVIPARSDVRQATGRLVLQDVYAGRMMAGVQRGEIKKLLVLESLPKPVNYSGKMPPMSWGGTYTLERILGTVPVEADGSAYFELPALRSLFFVALDEGNNSVKRMHSFLSVLPGEITGCVGCHEHRQVTPFVPAGGSLQALQRPPSSIEPLSGIPEVFDFPRDIQPVLDRHCVKCHDYDRRDGNLVLCGDRGPIFSHSYYSLTSRQLFSDGRDRMVTNLPPRSVGTSASPLMRFLDGSHYEARLSSHEQDLLRYWIESAAPYPGTYAALGSGMIGGFPKSKPDTTDQKWPICQAAAEAIDRRCGDCHDQSLPLPRYLSDDLGIVLSNPDMNDIRLTRFSRHLLFNLSRPEKSLILLAPLAQEAGGYGLCRQSAPSGLSGEPAVVFADTGDTAYQQILGMCQAGQQWLEQNKRFDMFGFRPDPGYVREMQRFGILPRDLPADALFDFYAADREYWRSLWWSPAATPRLKGSSPAARN